MGKRHRLMDMRIGEGMELVRILNERLTKEQVRLITESPKFAATFLGEEAFEAAMKRHLVDGRYAPVEDQARMMSRLGEGISLIGNAAAGEPYRALVERAPEWLEDGFLTLVLETDPPEFAPHILLKWLCEAYEHEDVDSGGSLRKRLKEVARMLPKPEGKPDGYALVWRRLRVGGAPRRAAASLQDLLSTALLHTRMFGDAAEAGIFTRMADPFPTRAEAIDIAIIRRRDVSFGRYGFEVDITERSWGTSTVYPWQFALMRYL